MGRLRGGGLIAALVALAATVLPVRAAQPATAAGRLDLSFGSCGISTIAPQDPDTGDEYVGFRSGDALAVQSDGKIVSAGPRVLTRRLPDGTTDYAFGSNGMAYGPRDGNEYDIADVMLQPDGRIVVAGTRWHVSDLEDRRAYFARHLPSGAIDKGFGAAGQVIHGSPGIAAAALQTDGKIVAAGGDAVLRLLPDGSLDGSFGAGGRATVPGGVIRAVAVQPDGKVVVGLTLVEPGEYDLGARRLNGNGSPDPTFASGGVARVDRALDELAGIAVDGSGRIVMAGTAFEEGRAKLLVARHLADGQPDPAFGYRGSTVVELPSSAQTTARDLLLQPDGKPVVAAEVTVPSGSLAVVRFATDGRLDGTFGDAGATLVSGEMYSLRFAVAQAPNSDLLVANSIGGTTVVRFHGDATAATPSAVTAATCTKRVQVSPVAALDYGLPPARKSTPKAYTVANTGTALVTVGRVTLMHASDFAVIADTCTARALAPRSSCQVLVSKTGPGEPFDPGTPVLTIRHNGERGWRPTYLFSTTTAAMQPASAAGWNGVGQVGGGPGDLSTSPVAVGLPDVMTVAAGYLHSLAVRWDGTVWAWGWNAVGQLGDGTTTDRRTPVQVPGLKDIATVAAGAHSSFAIATDGTVYAWGWNANGQLGDGSRTNRLRPVRLTSLPPVMVVAGGAYHTVAAASDHTVWSWGWNGFGQLGDASMTDRLTPARVDGLTNVKQVAAGMVHSLAVNLAGDVTAWGWNGVGQLGDGTTVDHARPHPVKTNGATWIAAGAHHSLAVVGERVVAWGWNALGQLGDGSLVDRHEPVLAAVPHVLGIPRNLTVSAGAFHSLATGSDGAVWGWGWNATGQLGLGTTTPTVPTPTRLSAWSAPLPVAGGYAHTVAG